MRKYCKAYHLKDLRQFSGWAEKSVSNDPEVPDETICYLWDDFIVVKSPVQDGGILFDEVTPEWQNFCEVTLNFAVPEELHSGYKYTEEQADTSVDVVEERNKAPM